MSLPYELFVGLRYTRAKKREGRNGFISFISLISMCEQKGTRKGLTVINTLV